ncbi:MAG: hypothetical protein A2W19_04010 [Spirochaetes bacterium RBG_16_49_21]|nr:MAG: hypothetical protein A2W19_04010 [Spirochaetes bacterium RBG_16_49_21]
MKKQVVIVALIAVLTGIAAKAQDNPDALNAPPIGFDKYPKREYPFLFNNALYNLLYRPTTITEFVTVPAGTIPSVVSFESGYSAIERLSNYPVNLLYDKIGVGWTSLIMLVKLGALDFPFAYFMKVFNHEYAGHTVRIHEAGQYIDRITIGVPLPWGRGGGATWGTVPQSIDHNILITAAGSEANTVMAHEMDLRFVSTGVIYPFDILLYLNAKFDELLYINRSTGHPSGLRMTADGDYEEYLILINNKYGRVLPHTYRLKLDELKRWSYIALADPFLYLATGALFYNLVTGKRYMDAFMIPLAEGAAFMPSARVAYTPNGPECYGDLFFKLPNRSAVLLAYARIGSTSLRQTWGGGARLYRMSVGRFVELGAGLDLFSQPRVMNHLSTYFIEVVYWNLYPRYISVNPAMQIGQLTEMDLAYGYRARGIKRIFGAAAYGDITVKANEFFRAYFRIGYKSNGYVFGLNLKKGLFWHAGMGFNF